MEGEFKILFFPWLAHGHVSPFFELANKLSKKNFKTYICSTPINLNSIQIPVDSTVEFVQLHMPVSSELPPELHTTRNLPSNLMPTLIRTFQLCDSIFSEIITSLKPDLLIYDMFQPWSAKLAKSMGIPSVHFAMLGATMYSYYHHIYTHGSSVPLPFESIYLHEHERLDPRAINAVIKDTENEFALGNFKLSTDIVLLKSYGQVEAKYADYLSVLSKKRLVFTGPLIAESAGNEKSKEIMNWLNEKNMISTLYISFGSEYFLSKEEMHQLAEGLELSGANFLWVIRISQSEKGTSLEEVLPEGFIERTKDVGMIVTDWAPQQTILAHQSTAAFVSHCGWSSVTESLYFAVPIIAMPMKVDQPVNAALVVESGTGVKIERKSGEIYMGEAIAKGINEVILDHNVYRNLKGRAVELSHEIKMNEEEEMNGVAAELLKICICMKNKPNGY